MNPDKLPEQFIPDHVFVCIVNGQLRCDDGTSSELVGAGQYYLFRRNRLVKYHLLDSAGRVEFIRICFGHSFLKQFGDKHGINVVAAVETGSFIHIEQNVLIDDFIHSIQRIYHDGEIDEPFSDVKQEELLSILLQRQPELSAVLFDFQKPGKIDIAIFMNGNYQFNVTVDQFAFLTGRSLSAFKREFAVIFKETPARWLVRKRLEVAYELLSKQHRKPSDIYLELGFETLSHFSSAFKKQYGVSPTALSRRV